MDIFLDISLCTHASVLQETFQDLSHTANCVFLNWWLKETTVPKESLTFCSYFMIPWASRVKNLPVMWETWVRSLVQEDSLEKGMGTHASVLAWRIPWTEEPGGLQSLWSQRVQHDWATNTFTLLSWFPRVGAIASNLTHTSWPLSFPDASGARQWWWVATPARDYRACARPAEGPSHPAVQSWLLPAHPESAAWDWRAGNQQKDTHGWDWRLFSQMRC